MTHIAIPRRYNGPPSSANGGFIGGILADRLGVASAEVTLRAPPPLDVPLEFRNDDEGALTLHDGETLLAEARAVELELDVPEAPSLDAAAAAGALGRMQAHARGDNPYRRCFGCGIDREDGLCIIPTPVGDAGVVASDWTPSESLAADDGTIPTPIVWTALDCSAGISWSYRLPGTPPLMTARISARIDLPLRASERYVVIGWPIMQDGRKLHSGTAIVDSDGVVRARSRQLWLLPRD